MMGLPNSNNHGAFSHGRRPNKVFVLPSQVTVSSQSLPISSPQTSLPALSSQSSSSFHSLPEVQHNKITDCNSSSGNGITKSLSSITHPVYPIHPIYLRRKKKKKQIHSFFAVRPPIGYPVHLRRPVMSSSNHPPAIGLLRPNIPPVNPLLPLMNPFLIPWFHPMSIWPSLMTHPAMYSSSGKYRPRYQSVGSNNIQYPVTFVPKTISSSVVPPSPASSIKTKSKLKESSEKSLDSSHYSVSNANKSLINPLDTNNPNMVASNFSLEKTNVSKPMPILTGLSSLGEHQQKLLWEALQQGYRKNNNDNKLLSIQNQLSKAQGSFSPLDPGISVVTSGDVQHGVHNPRKESVSADNTVHRNGLNPVGSFGQKDNNGHSSLSSSFPFTPKDQNEWSPSKNPFVLNDSSSLYAQSGFSSSSDHRLNHHNHGFFPKSHAFSPPVETVWLTKSSQGSRLSSSSDPSSPSNHIYYFPPSQEKRRKIP
jgi:hypothetical protein